MEAYLKLLTLTDTHFPSGPRRIKHISLPSSTLCLLIFKNSGFWLLYLEGCVFTKGQLLSYALQGPCWKLLQSFTSALVHGRRPILRGDSEHQYSLLALLFNFFYCFAICFDFILGFASGEALPSSFQYKLSSALERICSPWHPLYPGIIQQDRFLH